MGERWTPKTWRDLPIQQVPAYPDPAALGAVEAQLASFPPLVFAGEARKLKGALARVSPATPSCSRAAIAPKASPSTRPTTIRDSLRVFLQMALVAHHVRRPRLPVVKVGRVAGQFAKPRSAPTETRRRRRACRAIAAIS